MKPPAILLFGSLALNVALVAFWSLRSGSSLLRTAGNSPSRAASPSTNGSPNSSTPGEGKLDSASPTSDLVSAWSTLKSKALGPLVAQLRLAGFSEAMIRVIITMRVNEQFADRQRELAEALDRPYWKSRENFEISRLTDLDLRKLAHDKSDLIRQFVGPAGADSDVFAQLMAHRSYGDMPPAKMEAMQRISRDYAELRSEIYATSNGVILQEDRTKLDYLSKENRADVEKLLSPEELQQYDLRSSQGANFVRSKLGSFDLSEDEFKALYGSQQVFDAKIRSSGSAVPAGERSDAHDRQAALMDAAQMLFTPDRLAEFQLQSDPQYASAIRLAARLQLPSSAVIDVISVQKEIEQQATAVRADNSLTTEQRTAQLTTLARRAESKVSAVFGGQRGLEAYKQYGGQWLKTLNQPPSGPAVR